MLRLIGQPRHKAGLFVLGLFDKLTIINQHMRFLYCPQCGIRRFQVKDGSGNSRVVHVTDKFEIVPAKEGESLEGFNLDIIYCLGCSWKGHVTDLKKYPV